MKTLKHFVILLFSVLLFATCKDKGSIGPDDPVNAKLLKPELAFDAVYSDSGAVRLTNKSKIVGRGIDLNGITYPVTKYSIQWQHLLAPNGYVAYGESSKLMWETNGIKRVKMLFILESDSARNGSHMIIDTTIEVNIQNAIYKTVPVTGLLQGKLFGKEFTLDGSGGYYYIAPSTYGGPFGYSEARVSKYVEDEQIAIVIVDKNKVKPHKVEDKYQEYII